MTEPVPETTQAPPVGRFRKRPVDVKATRWWKNGDHPADGVGETVADLVEPGTYYVRQEGAVVRYFRHPDYPGDQVHDRCGRTWHDHGWIDTLEGGHTVCPGDWIITGVQGERYPCKPDIFAATYEAAPEPLELTEVERAAVERSEHMSTCHEMACVECMRELRAIRRTVKAVTPVIEKQLAEKHERELLDVIDERDHNQHIADALAAAIAGITGVDIGEHSSANDPWRNALDVAAGFSRAAGEPEGLRVPEDRARAAVEDVGNYYEGQQ